MGFGGGGKVVVGYSVDGEGGTRRSSKGFRREVISSTVRLNSTACVSPTKTYSRRRILSSSFSPGIIDSVSVGIGAGGLLGCVTRLDVGGGGAYVRVGTGLVYCQLEPVAQSKCLLYRLRSRF